ncbi:hypothetical protein EBU95_17400 [bacterium]|nr:hypothetical protein [bacterium]
MLDNCTSLIKFDNPFKNDEIAPEIKKAVQIVNYYTEEKNQNWLWFRWKIWEEICRQMPVKTKQPLWPFGKLVYYDKRFVFGLLDIWIAHYWNTLNEGILYLENSYLEPFEYKKRGNRNKIKNKKTCELNEQKKDFDQKEHLNILKTLAENYKEENFIHSKDFTEAKRNYLLEEESKFDVKRETKNSPKKYNIKTILK